MTFGKLFQTLLGKWQIHVPRALMGTNLVFCL